MTFLEFLQLLQSGATEVRADELEWSEVSVDDLGQMMHAIRGHQTLTHLVMGELNISATRSFSSALEKNTSLQSLDLQLSHFVPKAGFPTLVSALEKNSILTKLDLAFHFGKNVDKSYLP